jgi:hypothetical protein
MGKDHFFEKGIRLMIPFDKETRHESLVLLICLIPFYLHTSSTILRSLGMTAKSAVGNK